ncbi:hypothetical protein [Rheinheimera pacifica]|uniref:hypothetical protein n=1 Tax=Rheinheimera pacifica TaxID=173990 RepID=UPI002EDA376D
MKILIKPALVLVFLLTGIGGSAWLMSQLNLSEASFMVLVTLSAIFSILLPNLNQLKSFSITKGELILQEVKDSEAAIKELAIATADLVEAANEGSIVSHGFNQARYDQAVEKIRALTSKT